MFMVGQMPKVKPNRYFIFGKKHKYLRRDVSVYDKPPYQKKEKKCKWPIGEVGKPGFHFCEEPAIEGRSPYCQCHTNIAYNVNPDRYAKKQAATKVLLQKAAIRKQA